MPSCSCEAILTHVPSVSIREPTLHMVSFVCNALMSCMPHSLIVPRQ